MVRPTPEFEGVAYALVKLENTPLHKGAYGASMRQLGAYIKQQAVGALIGAMLAHNVAFTKL